MVYSMAKVIPVPQPKPTIEAKQTAAQSNEVLPAQTASTTESTSGTHAPRVRDAKEEINFAAVTTRILGTWFGTKIPGAPLLNPSLNAGIGVQETANTSTVAVTAEGVGSATVTMLEGKLLPLPAWIADVALSSVGGAIFGEEAHRAAGGYVFGNANTFVQLAAANLDAHLGNAQGWEKVTAQIRNGDRGVLWQHMGKAVENAVAAAEKAGIPVRELRNGEIKYTQNGIEIAKTVVRAWVLKAKEMGVPFESIESAFKDMQNSVSAKTETFAKKNAALLNRIF